MRRSGVVVAGGIVLALLVGGVLTANALTVRDEAGAPLSVDPVVATPDPSLPAATPEPTPTATPEPTPTAAPNPAPIPPAPPQDVDDDDDDDDDFDDDDDDD